MSDSINGLVIMAGIGLVALVAWLVWGVAFLI